MVDVQPGTSKTVRILLCANSRLGTLIVEECNVSNLVNQLITLVNINEPTNYRLPLFKPCMDNSISVKNLNTSTRAKSRAAPFQLRKNTFVRNG